MPIDAASHFSGKRLAERRPVDVRVELRGGGIVLQGRTFDLSPQGVGVLLTERTFQGFREATDAVSTYALMQRHFTSGVEIRFPVNGNVRVFGQIVRVSTPPKEGADITIGCKFVRTLSPQEWALVVGAARPATPEPLVDLTPGPAVQLLVFDPASPAAGPLELLEVLRGSSEAVEAILQTARPISPDAVRTELDRGALPARMLCTGAFSWDGFVRLGEAREGERSAVIVRLDAISPWSPLFLKRLETRPAAE